MRSNTPLGFRRNDPNPEHIRKREELRKTVGTPEFPTLCPLEFMEMPNGYRFWYELFSMHRMRTEKGQDF